jgi:AraC-like DNA-binding protein
MRSPLVRPMLQFVRASGGDPGRLIREFSLPATAETDPEAVLPLPALQAFFEAAEAAIADPFLGIHVAAHFKRGTYGVLEYSWRSAPTIREAMARLVRCIALLNDFVVISLVERGDRAVLEQSIPGRPLCVGRHGNEFFIAAVLLQARSLSGAPFIPERVWFAHPAPKDRSELFRLLGTSQVEFGGESNGMELGADLLALPIASADPTLLSLLDRCVDQDLALRASPSRFLGQVRQGISAKLSEEPPSLAITARALRMSPRTLQRRIAAEGTSFQELVESVREELARVYVKDPKRSIGEIAYLLGYAELSPFLRAFKRWTGVTPSQFRAAAP